MDAGFIGTLVERRKYNYASLRDLLRAIRNKKVSSSSIVCNSCIGSSAMAASYARKLMG